MKCINCGKTEKAGKYFHVCNKCGSHFCNSCKRKNAKCPKCSRGFLK